jgi:hypothetical protein
VIVVEGDRVKLVDFGVAKLAGQLAGGVKTVSGALIGTPVYMSPEQCEGVRELDARSDLYSLGCMMFAMMTGTPPFVSNGVGALISMHLHDPAPALRSRCPAASPVLEAVVARLLAKSPADRFQSAHEVSATLAASEITELAASVDGAAATAQMPEATTATQLESKAQTVRVANPPAQTPPPNVSLPMTADTASPSTRRRWLVAGFAVAAAIAAIVVFAKLRAESGASDDLVKLAHVPIDAAATPPIRDAVVEPVIPRNIVTITIEGAPASTEVHIGGKLYGVVPRIEVPRANQEVMLVLSHDGYQPLALSVTPDRDQRFPAKLKPRSGSRPPESGEPTQDILKFPEHQ